MLKFVESVDNAETRKELQKDNVHPRALKTWHVSDEGELIHSPSGLGKKDPNCFKVLNFPEGVIIPHWRWMDWDTWGMADAGEQVFFMTARPHEITHRLIISPVLWSASFTENSGLCVKEAGKLPEQLTEVLEWKITLQGVHHLNCFVSDTHLKFKSVTM